jgi:protein SCO1/2
MNDSITRRGALLGTLALLAGCEQKPQKTAAQASFKGADLSDRAGNFRLQDPQGRERTLADYRGRAVLLHFGFTLCPDACPTALARAVQVRAMLGEQAKRLQVLFVTLDPERDTGPLMAAYTAAFDPSFVGLRGDAERTRETAAAFKVFYRRVETGSTYTFDHSTLGFGFDPEGKLRVGLRHTQTPEDCVHDLRQLLA